MPTVAPTTAATDRHPDLPLVVVGAGPAGLAAAAQANARGIATVVLEAGAAAGAAVTEWGHVRLFSPWSELMDPVAVSLLTETGWTSPDPASYPTGRDWVERYLAPLAAASRVARASRSATATGSSASRVPAATGWSRSAATRCRSASTSPAPTGAA